MTMVTLNGFRSTTVVSEIKANVPNNYELLQNYPNPFNPITIISYQLAENSFVKLKVYDLLGREVSTLVNAKEDAGYYHVTFDGTYLTSGVIFLSITCR